MLCIGLGQLTQVVGRWSHPCPTPRAPPVDPPHQARRTPRLVIDRPRTRCTCRPSQVRIFAKWSPGRRAKSGRCIPELGTLRPSLRNSPRGCRCRGLPPGSLREARAVGHLRSRSKAKCPGLFPSKRVTWRTSCLRRRHLLLLSALRDSHSSPSPSTSAHALPACLRAASQRPAVDEGAHDLRFALARRPTRRLCGRPARIGTGSPGIRCSQGEKHQI
mmetsp:Transcript_25733/g.62237  ORF Transcript_25733/g.62237 Transcript_25733/m.62237 type:complete len:218 (+) Transcript_25733:191-844(+)